MATNWLVLLKAYVDTLETIVGTEGGVALANKLTAARAALLDQITAARLAELDAGNIPTDLANIIAYVDLIDDVTNGLAAIKAEVEGLAGAAMRGTDGAALAASWTAALATILDNFTAARIGYLDNLSAGAVALDATVANILLDTQIRKAQSGIKAIDAAATKYLHIDSGTNGAEILSIAIEGVIGHDWTLDVYVPATDAEAATQPQSKRNTITYAAADTEGGLLGPFGIPFDSYLDFTNNGANDQIDQVTITYRSRGALTLSWEA